jgi:hypothetical protein
VSQLQEKILYTCKDDPCIQMRVDEVRTILRDYTAEALNRSGGDTSQLEAELRSITTTGTPGEVERVFRHPGAGGDLIVTLSVVAYGALAITQNAVIVQGFRKDGQQFVFAGENDDALWGVRLNSADLIEQSARPGELWILAYGRATGASHNWIQAGIYGFDGYRFERLWRPPSREDLDLRRHRGEIDVYYRERHDKESGFPDMDLIHQILQLTISGVVEGASTNLGPVEDVKEPQR